MHETLLHFEQIRSVPFLASHAILLCFAHKFGGQLTKRTLLFLLLPSPKVHFSAELNHQHFFITIVFVNNWCLSSATKKKQNAIPKVHIHLFSLPRVRYINPTSKYQMVLWIGRLEAGWHKHIYIKPFQHRSFIMMYHYL